MSGWAYILCDKQLRLAALDRNNTITIFKEENHVSIIIPAHNRGPTDSKCIFGKVLNMDESKPDYYQVITLYKVLNKLFSIKDLLLLLATILLNIPSKQMKRITLVYNAYQE